MATTPWAIPTGKAITGTTFIKDTDNYLAATIEDLVDWCNNASGTYNDYTSTGLRTDFLTKTSAQTLTSVTTVDTLGAIDFTGGELRIGGVAVTSTGAELNILDGVTATTAEINVLDGISPTLTATELNVLDGIPATLTATELGYVDGVTSSIQTQINGKASLAGDTFTGQVKGITPVSAEDLTRKDYVDNKVSSLNATSGFYTPTITSITNVASTTSFEARYIRVGNIVQVSGLMYIKATSAGSMFTVELSLPVTSTFTDSTQASGVMIQRGTVQSTDGAANAVSSTNRIEYISYADTTNTLSWNYEFSYRIL